MWDNSTMEGEGTPRLERGVLSARQSPFHAEPASRQAIGPVGRSAATLSWAVPSSAERLRFPTLRLNPSLENPLENLFLVGVSAASGSGGAGEGERPLQPPRRQGRRTPQASACSLGLRPSGVRALDLGGHSAATDAPTASLRRSRAVPAAELGRKGGSPRPVQRIFSGASCAAVREAAGLPKAAGGDAPQRTSEALRDPRRPGSAFPSLLGK